MDWVFIVNFAGEMRLPKDPYKYIIVLDRMIYLVLFFLYFIEIANKLARIFYSFSVKDILIQSLIYAQTLIDFGWKVLGVEKEIGGSVIIAPVKDEKYVPINKTYTFTVKEEAETGAASVPASVPTKKKRGRKPKVAN